MWDHQTPPEAESFQFCQQVLILSVQNSSKDEDITAS